MIHRQSSPDTVARLMADFRSGDSVAAGKLVDLFYPELRRLAGERMRHERLGHTWEPTALVNELYLSLVKIRALRAIDSDREQEHQAFIRLAAHIMKRLLIQHARPLSKRATKIELFDILDTRSSGVEALAEVESALRELDAINPDVRAVVQLRVFEGLTGEETARRIGCGTATVTRHWNFARHWLAREFGKASPE
jgi:RNA polymerase sigma factor (TIGR02999 family)